MEYKELPDPTRAMMELAWHLTYALRGGQSHASTRVLV